MNTDNYNLDHIDVVNAVMQLDEGHKIGTVLSDGSYVSLGLPTIRYNFADTDVLGVFWSGQLYGGIDENGVIRRSSSHTETNSRDVEHFWQQVAPLAFQDLFPQT